MSEVKERLAANVVTSDNLAEFTARKLGLVDRTEETAASSDDKSDDEPEHQASQSDSHGEGNDATVDDEPKDRKANPKIQTRFSEITKQREAARAEAQKEREARQDLEVKLKEMETRSKPQAKAQDDELGPEPLPESFNDMFEYAKALAEFTADKKMAERDRADANRKAAEVRQTFEKAWADRVDSARAGLPDFDAMIQSSDVSISDPVRDAIMESDVGPQILYHLAENTEFANDLSRMSVISALRQIGRLEVRFEKTAPKASEPTARTTVAKSRAPAPITPIRGAISKTDNNVDSDGNFHGTFAQWKAARQSKSIR